MPFNHPAMLQSRDGSHSLLLRLGRHGMAAVDSKIVLHPPKASLNVGLQTSSSSHRYFCINRFNTSPGKVVDSSSSYRARSHKDGGKSRRDSCRRECHATPAVGKRVNAASSNPPPLYTDADVVRVERMEPSVVESISARTSTTGSFCNHRARPPNNRPEEKALKQTRPAPLPLLQPPIPASGGGDHGHWHQMPTRNFSATKNK